MIAPWVKRGLSTQAWGSEFGSAAPMQIAWHGHISLGRQCYGRRDRGMFGACWLPGYSEGCRAETQIWAQIHREILFPLTSACVCTYMYTNSCSNPPHTHITEVIENFRKWMHEEDKVLCLSEHKYLCAALTVLSWCCDLEIASVEQLNTMFLAVSWFLTVKVLFYIGKFVTQQRKFR